MLMLLSSDKTVEWMMQKLEQATRI